MARLALSVEDESQLRYDRASLRIARRTGQAAFRNLGETILLYRPATGAFVVFFASAQISGVEIDTDKRHFLCRLQQLVRFDAPVVSDAEIVIPGVRRLLALSSERFSEIFDRARSQAESHAEAAEAAVAFEHSRSRALAIYLAIHDEVLGRWDYRCAITGMRFAPAARPHPSLRVVAIRPRDRGGPFHVRNYLPLTEMAERAWTHGHLTVGHELGLLADLARIEPELLEAIRPEFQLLVPEDPQLWPDPEHIAFHREHVFGA